MDIHNNISYPIRVLHVLHSMDCGGAENMVMNYYRNIDRTKVQFDFLIHTNKKCYFDDEIKSLGGHIYHAPYYNVLNYFSYCRFLENFFIDHSEIKIVHGHLGSCSHIYLRTAKKYGCFCIAHAHSTKSRFKFPISALYRYGLKKTRKYADYFFGCSKDALLYRYGSKIIEDKKNSSVMVNAIDLSSYVINFETRTQIAKEFNIEDDEIVVGHVGRFCEQKNHTFLIDVFCELTKKDDKYKLMLVGDGPLKHQIEDKCKKLDIYDKVIFTGVRNDVNRLMQRMDVFLFPSIYEGLGIALIEAQATGLPCFVSDTVPREAKLTDFINFLSLDKDAKHWAKNIPMSNIVKDSNLKNDALHIYDIKKCTKELEKFYINKID